MTIKRRRKKIENPIWREAEKVIIIHFFVFLFFPKLLTIVAPKAISISITKSDYYTNAAIVGWIGAIMGMIGAIFGKIVETQIVKKTNDFWGRFTNDFFRTMFWIFGILITMFLFNTNTNYQSNSPFLFSYIIIMSIISGIFMGLLFPLLNLLFYGNFIRNFNFSLLRNPIKWFVTAGVLFGSAAGTSFVIINQNMNVFQILGSIIFPGTLCSIYGIFCGIAVYKVGGIGSESATTYTEGLAGSMAGLFFGALSGILYAVFMPSLRTIPSLFMLILSGSFVGLFLGSNYPPNLKKLIKDLFYNQFEQETITPAMKVIFIFITGLPWGMIVAIGISLSNYLFK